MGEILEIIEKYSGGTCYQTQRYNLDHFVPPEYQDKDEDFSSDKIFESDNKQRQPFQLEISSSVPSLFCYFLDGSRKTYKIVDFGSTDGKFVPIVAGQIGSAVCFRQNGKLKQYQLRRENAIVVPDRMGDEFDSIARAIPKIKIPKNHKNGLSIHRVLKYKVSDNPDRPLENLAIAQIQVVMMNMEVELIREMAHSQKLKTDSMLMVDGSLQFSSIGSLDELAVFQNVVGVSKTFNPNLRGILKSKNRQIGGYLTNLRFGERTPVFVYDAEGTRSGKIKIGAWYIRIHPGKNMQRPLDGVIKVEKIATTRRQREDGFDTAMINEISKSILIERNVTCYGNDQRWPNHLYPIYLTETFLKSTFVSNDFFLNIF